MPVLRIVSSLVWLLFMLMLGSIPGVNRGDLLVAQVGAMLGLTMTQIEYTLIEIQQKMVKRDDFS